MHIEQDRPRGDPVKTEYGKGQGTALVEPDEEAVELRSTTLNSSRWSQIKESFKKAMEPKGVKVLRWYLCMPREIQKEDIEKWKEYKEKKRMNSLILSSAVLTVMRSFSDWKNVTV